MKTVSKWLLALTLAFTFFLIPNEASATPVCYQATSITGPFSSSYVGTLVLIPANCSVTPAGHGWFTVDTAPYELYVAIPYAWPLNGNYYIFYQGEVSGVPDLLLDIVVGDPQAAFPLDSDPPVDCEVSTDRSLVPAMTSNTAPSGTAAASGSYTSAYPAWKAFDGTTGTSWLSNQNTSSVWIDYEWGGGTSRLVKSYKLTYANGSCCEQRGPKNWTLQGWNGVAWTTIDTASNETGWLANPIRTYTVDNPGSYSKYRLDITADNYNNATYPIHLVSIAEIELIGQNTLALVPTMTSSTAPSGTVSRSGVMSSTYEAWQAFDGTTATGWLSNMYTTSVWIDYEWGGGNRKAVNSYQLTYANGSCCENRGPKNWTLQGWNGSAWVTVDTVTNQTGWYANSIRSFAVDNPGCYTKYRLNITADNFNSVAYPINLVSIVEIQLYGDTP